MNRTRRAALTATLATTAALSIAGVSWGIGSTVTGQATGAGQTYSVTVDDDVEAQAGYGRGGGRGGSGPGNHSDIPDAIPGATISDSVTEQLLYLVEEEKLAGDVYALAESQYGDRIFANIGRAEDHHADEVRVLLDRYGIDDPTVGAAAGEFTDPQLQAQYAQLSDQVEDSRADAIAAGILVEQTDIDDLQELVSSDLPDDVRAVVDNLLAGSQRHLAAFQRQAA